MALQPKTSEERSERKSWKDEHAMWKRRERIEFETLEQKSLLLPLHPVRMSSRVSPARSWHSWQISTRVVDVVVETAASTKANVSFLYQTLPLSPSLFLSFFLCLLETPTHAERYPLFQNNCFLWGVLPRLLSPLYFSRIQGPEQGPLTRLRWLCEHEKLTDVTYI